MTKPPDHPIAAWCRQRQANDQAALAEIAARYQLRPAASMDELLARMDPADAETIREILTHTIPSAAPAGFSVEQCDAFLQAVRRGAPPEKR